MRSLKIDIMNILFLSNINPFDINAWSGTAYYIYNSLKKKHNIQWVGGEILLQTLFYSRNNLSQNDLEFNLVKYAPIIGKLLSERINRINCDLVFFGDNHLVSYLDIRVPIVHFSDTTYHLFKNYHNSHSMEQIRKAETIEKLAIEKYSALIFSSEWAKQETIGYYGTNPNKMHVVELGANIPNPPKNEFNKIDDDCKLVFIGKNWKKKGGDKVLNAFKRLRSEGFPCRLTIIGSVPTEPQDKEDNLIIIPFLDKSESSNIELLNLILKESDFLVLPTEFECFGVVFCEASAYGVPSIAANVGGVSQAIREGKNGFLLSPNASAYDYATIIKTIFEDKDRYLKLRETSRKEFDERLNWNVWLEKTDKILQDVITKYSKTKKNYN
jgi:glycosyltransferase involved in cell wall biosynthesis